MEAISKQLCFEKNEMQTSTDQPMLVSKKTKKNKNQRAKLWNKTLIAVLWIIMGNLVFPLKHKFDAVPRKSRDNCDMK